MQRSSGSAVDVERSSSRERREKKEKKDTKEKKEKKDKGSRHNTPAVASPSLERKERRGSRREREANNGGEVSLHVHSSPFSSLTWSRTDKDSTSAEHAREGPLGTVKLGMLG